MSLKHSILALLSRTPKTGYGLATDSDGSTRFFWSATHQQIYKELGELEERGWVKHKAIEQTEKPDKKLYSTTKAGLDELKRWMFEETEPQPSKDALLIKIFVGELVEPEVLLTDLLKHKKIHQEKRRRYQEIEKEYFQNFDQLPTKRQFQYLTLRRGMTYETAWLSWAKEVEEFLLSRQKKQLHGGILA